MPGVTTMWIGSAARALWDWGYSTGWWTKDDTSFSHSNTGLTTAQVLAAISTSLLIGLVVFLLTRWAGFGTATVAGALLATEPFFVALGSVQHPDALLTPFVLGAMVATALALGLPNATAWQGHRWAAFLAGLLWAGALLTKLSALPFLLSAGALGGWAVLRSVRARARERKDELEGVDDEAVLSTAAIARLGAVCTAAALTVLLVAYPALLVNPVGELQNLLEGMELASEQGGSRLFLGKRTSTAGPLYYLVALPLRITPWFLVTGVLAGIGLWWHKPSRGFATAALLMAGPSFVVASFASKQAARYGLPILGVGVIVVGIALSALIGPLLRRGRSRYRWPVIGLGSVAGLFLLANTITVAPWGLAYFNPILGGGATAERAIQVGWGEGLERAGRVIDDLESDRCDELLIWSFPVTRAFPCGEVIYTYRTDADYVVVYVGIRQRRSEEYVERRTRQRELIDVIEIRGIEYAEIYGAFGTAD